ncbi:hypothetical protein PG994_013323 [Apiospora phragmitis]|uniref:Uncharacterized protein n=1 Tax=Apiospora phragmitis TaxID=2905665 RepID=A0ABR1T8B3_9PEZI
MQFSVAVVIQVVALASAATLPVGEYLEKSSEAGVEQVKSPLPGYIRVPEVTVQQNNYKPNWKRDTEAEVEA